MALNSKVKYIYDTLKNGGGNVGSEQEFNDWFFAKGKEGYQNRKYVYETLTKGGGDAGKSYEEFRDWLGLHAVKPQAQVKPQQPSATQQPQVRKAQAKPQTATPMTAEERERMMTGVDALKQRAANTVESGVKRVKNIDTYRKNKQKSQYGNVQLGYERPSDVGKTPEEIREETPNTYGDNQNVVRGEDQFDAETGEFKPSYVTSFGNAYENKAEANQEQDAIDEAMRTDEERMQANRQQVNGLAEDIDNYMQQVKDESGRGALSMGVYYGQAGNSMMENPEWMAAASARTAIQNARNIIAEADHNAQNGTFGKWWESSFAGGAARGFGQKLFDVHTWDMGLSDTSESRRLLDALNKADKGQPLTKGEQMMLDAKAVELATQAYFGSAVGHGYKAGQVTAEALPFMLEMYINPASAAGRSAQSMLTRYALKKFGKSAIKKGGEKWLKGQMLRKGGRVLGDIGGAMAMSGTTGAARTMADATQRHIGDLKFDAAKGGQVRYGGHENGQDWGEAIAKAYAGTTIENYSEMVGAYLDLLPGLGAKLATKGLDKIGLSKVNDFIRKVKATDIAKAVDDFAKETQWHGVFGEYAEEVVGNVMNALLVGDSNFDVIDDEGNLSFHEEGSVFNLDDNLETFLGVSLMGGVMSGVKTLGYRTPKYQARKDMERANRQCLQAFNGNRDLWGQFAPVLATGSDEDIKGLLHKVLTDEVEVTPEQKMAMLNYVKESQKYKGVLQAENKRRTDDDANETLTDLETSFDNGYNLQTAKEQHDAKNMRDYTRQRLEELVSEDMMRQFDEDPMTALYIIHDNEQWTDEDKQKALDYVNAKATYDGMIQSVRDRIETETQQATEEIDSRVASEEQGGDGKIHPATMKADDRQVYIVSGNVRMLDDGSMVDRENSDKDLIVRDAETGKVEFVSIDDILRTDEVEDAEQLKQEAVQNIQETVATEASNAIDGVLSFEPNSNFTIMSDDGAEHTVQVVQDQGDGTVAVLIDGAIDAVPMAKEQLQEMSEAYNMSRLQQYEAEKAVERAEEAQEQSETAEGAEEVAEGTEGTPAQETLAEEEEPMPMIGEGEDAEPDFASVTPERAHKYVYEESGLDEQTADEFVGNNLKAAQKELDKAKSKTPKMGTSISQYNKAKQEYDANVNAAQQRVDYWNQLKSEHENTIAQRNAERAAERKAIEEREKAKAEAEEAARQAEITARQEEEQARGANTVGEQVKQKWNDAPKVEGSETEITLQNGERVKGRYMLVESGAATASHDARNGFARSEGFPVDESGQTVNDRDYERDKDAQNVTRSMGEAYDSRAIQDVPVVSRDGVVLSGNGRTMAGEIAAQNGTDGAYTEHLRNYGSQYGFTQEQVDGMQHPRLVFVPEGDMPYTTETFAKFNEQAMKSQSKTEKAVKMGKVVDDATYNNLVSMVSGFDSLSDFYNSPKGGAQAVNALQQAGVVNEKQMAELYDGEKLSEAGRALLESVLIGKAFEGNADMVRMLSEFPSLRRSVVQALTEIGRNKQLGNDYNVADELAEAVKLAYNARKQGYTQGQSVSAFARQLNLFPFDEGSETVADYTNATILMLADALNDNRETLLRNSLALYNDAANDAAAGQLDIFGGGVRSKETIIKDVLNFLNNGERKEQQAALNDVAERRKANATSGAGSTEEDGTDGASDEAGAVSEGAAEVQQSTDQKVTLSEHYDGEVTSETTADRYGNTKTTFAQYRKTKSGQIKRVTKGGAEITADDIDFKAESEEFVEELTNSEKPIIVLEIRRSKDGADATIRHDGVEYDVRMKPEAAERIIKQTEQANSVGAEVANVQGNEQEKEQKNEKLFDFDEIEALKDAPRYVRTAIWDNATKAYNDALAKVNPFQFGIPEEKQERMTFEKFRDEFKEVAGTFARGTDDYLPAVYEYMSKRLDIKAQEKIKQDKAIQIAEQETNTNPTEAQKEAGNYKKGHVRIDGFDVTIENPKGSVRRGTDVSGKQWEQEMQNTYGYIRGTEGVDGDHIDVFLSDDPSQGDVFVVDQVNKDGSFDEHKVMYGFSDAESARKAYLANYEEGWQGLGAITPVSKEEFKKWINSSHRKTKPFAEYSSVKPLEENKKVTEESLKQFLGDWEKDPENATKAVDKKGQPIVVYRGGGRLDNIEDASNNAMYGKAYYATPDRAGAEEFAEERTGDKNNVQAAYINVRHPFVDGDVDGFNLPSPASDKEINALVEVLAKKGLKNPKSFLWKWNNGKIYGSVLGHLASEEYEGRERPRGMFWHAGDIVQEALKELGYDGVIGMYSGMEFRYPQVAVFDMGQVMEVPNETSEQSGAAEAEEEVTTNEQPQQEEKKPKSKWVDDEDAERFEQLKAKLRQKMRGQMNMGVDPEIFALGTQMAFMIVKHGARKFADYARAMIDEMGDDIRKQLKTFYNGARDMMEDSDNEAENKIAAEMDDYDTVRKFDVANFDKPATDVFATAEQVVNEQEAEKEAETAKEKIKAETRKRINELRKKYPDNVVFPVEHADGSATYYDNDARIVAELLGVELDGTKLTVDKEQFDKSLQKLIASGRRVGMIEYNATVELSTEQPEQKKPAEKKATKPQKDASAPKTSGARTSGKGKIEDVGERLEGARKDALKVISKSFADATEKALTELPFSKAFKKPDLKKAVENGALREEDAQFYEAYFATMVDSTKPKVTQRDVRWKKYDPNYETSLDKWVKRTFEALTVLKGFVEATPEERDEIMRTMLEDHYPTREEELAHIEQLKAWNPDRTYTDEDGKEQTQKHEWGDKTSPNPLWVTSEILSGLGYKVGDKVDIPYGVVKANTSGTGYTLENLKGERNYYTGPFSTVEEAIEGAIYLAKLKRGDTDLQHPRSSFSVKHTNTTYKDSGRYRVIYGSKMAVKEFDSKEEADKFVKEKEARAISAYASPIQEVDERTDYVVTFRNPLTGETTQLDIEKMATKAEAMSYLYGNIEELNEKANALLQSQSDAKGKKKEITADDMMYAALVYANGKVGYSVMINTDISKDALGFPHVVRDGFATRKEALDFIEEHKAEVYDAYKKHVEAKKSYTYFSSGADTRAGEDYRGGKDVTAEDFMNEFGFRGVQFGNWTNQADRQMAINQAYDALIDLARLLGVSPRAISLNGKLGIAFGSRGSGNANAHFEPGEFVINLTKTRGAGSLAHEWWHALDNYFAKNAGMAQGYVTETTSLEMRQQLREAFNRLLDVVRDSDYYERSKKQGAYWGSIIEVTARLFAEWADRELKKKGDLNTFLTRGADFEKWQEITYETHKYISKVQGKEPMTLDEWKRTKDSLKGLPYPSEQEVNDLGDAVRNIFDTVQERIDEETGNVALFHKASEEASEVSEQEGALRDALVETMRNAGIEVVADEQEGQRVLDIVNGENATLSKAQKRAAETASLNHTEGSPADISTADGAKVLNNLENLAKDYDNLTTNNRKSFLNDVAEALSAKNHGSNSQYATFETKNGQTVTIRLANHNAKVSTFDNHGEDNGISIVVSKRSNNGITNDGKAHIVEFFYPEIGLRKADGKPLADIVRAIKQSLYSGEFNDPTGIAERQEVNDDLIREHRSTKDNVSQEIFVSNARRAVEGIKQEKATAEQWLAMLQKNGGLKAGEDKWLGLSDWLKDKKGSVTKQEILDFIAENQIQIEDVHYAENPSEEALGIGEGGTGLINSMRLSFTTKGLQNKREIALTVPTIEPYNEHDEVHFGDAGEGRAVAWCRFGETTDKDGKRVLVIDEIQSKRHQDGREKGYRTYSVEELNRLSTEAENNRHAYSNYENEIIQKYDILKGRVLSSDDVVGEILKVASPDEIKKLRDLREAELNSLAAKEEYEKTHGVNRRDLVPDAPFEKNWHELVMKRMLRYAAENGYDKVAWTTGKQQAKRYSLSNKIEDFYYKKNEDGTYNISALAVVKRNGYTDYKEYNFDNQTEKQLTELLGKDITAKIVSGKGRKGYTHKGTNDWTTFKGKELEMGGEGMKGFYDEILPRFMNKYGKKWGAQVGETELSQVEETGRRMWSVDVTPQMKESVMMGQPMFFRTANGKAYGFVKDGKMYIDPSIATSETPVHEYTHLWAEALRKGNPEKWEEIKRVLLNDESVKPFIDEVHKKYPELTNEDDLLDEVLAHYSGKRGAERLRAEAQRIADSKDGVFEKADVFRAMNKLKDAIRRFWQAFADFMHIPYRSADEIADRVMYDLLSGVNPKAEAEKMQQNPHKARQLEIVTKENPMRDDYHIGIRSIDDIKTYEEAVNEGEGIDIYPDFTEEDARKALESGEVTVYSSYPIENGVFVSTSRKEAEDYAGGGKVYSKRVLLSNVAWLYANEGQYAEVDDEGSELFRDEEENNNEQVEEDDSVLMRDVDDEELIEQLEREPKVKVYRSMVLIDGKLYPPMSSKSNGKLRKPSELGKWEEAEEAPEKAKQGENGKWYFSLKKDNGKSVDNVAYNPYIHTSTTMLNDQFMEAQSRDNLVVVEMEVPVSELTSGYRAEKAHDTTGVKQWKAGPIQGQLTGTREVILTRWAKPIRIVPTEEVAQSIAEQIDGQVRVMPSNVVTPQVREALEALGVQFVETNNKGKLTEGVDVGKTWVSVYGNKKTKKKGRTMQREGDGSVLSMSQDKNYSRKQRWELMQREWKRMQNKAKELIDILKLDRIAVYGTVEDMPEGMRNSLSERKKKAKGWYDTKTGKIVIILGNHRNAEDVAKTILHEAVAHYGLRRLFGKNFDTFLDNVYQNADVDVKMRIADMAARQRAKDSAANRARRTNEDYLRIGTEEYLAKLAEDMDFENRHESFWSKIKSLFIQMLESIGLKDYEAGELSDNELKYILWRSYKNLSSPGEYRNVFDMAEDIVMQENLGVGNFTRGEMPESMLLPSEKEERKRVAEQGMIGEYSNDTEGTIAEYINKIRSHYGLRGGAIHVAIGSREDIAFLRGKISDNDYDAIVEEYEKPNVKGVYLYDNNIVVVFSGKCIDEADGEEVWTHEQTHGFFDTLSEDEQAEIGEECLNYLKEEKPDVYDKITTKYPESEWHSEACAYTISETIKDYGLHNFLQSSFGGNKKIAIFADEFKKHIKDGKEKRTRGERNLFRQKIQEEEHEAEQLGGRSNQGRKVKSSERVGREISLVEDDELFRDAEERDRVTARDMYERMVSSGRYQFQEAVQDSMLGLKALYKAVLGKNTNMEDVPGNENAYMAENLMSSATAAEQSEYFIRYMKPLIETIHKLCGSNKKAREELTNYLMAKHGLERNRILAERDFKEYQAKHPTGAKTLADFRERDYAGLTALTEYINVSDAEAEAQRMVDAYEQTHDVTELWQNIKAANEATLTKLWLSGVLSRERYDQIRDMFEYYIPLQGFEEKTSDEVYGYLTSKNGPLMGSPIKRAKGRSSKADDPIATMGLMADKAIQQGNRNRMKICFLNFVQNHPSDLVSVNRLWLKYDDVTDEWVPMFADISPEDTAEEVEQKVEQFEQKMQALAQADPDHYKYGREAQNIPYRVVSGNLREHQVLVKRAGDTYVLTINGNPRAAQALNGLTNPDVEQNGVIGKLLSGAEYINRQLSAFYTTRNPDFVASNFLRDMIYSNCMSWAKEGANYGIRFNKNFAIYNPVRMARLYRKWENGTLNMGDKTESLFYEFMRNGGETGYTNVRDLEAHKRSIAQELKRQGNTLRAQWHALGELFDLVNRSVENTARFAAFVTSKELGRTTSRAVYDAKEISVNFNKKGSGSKMLGAQGQTLLGNIGAYISGIGRLAYVFWNAGVQGTTNLGKAIKRRPKSTLTGLASIFALGYIIPTAAAILAGGGGDDDDDDKNGTDYWDLPEYVRRSNICFKVSEDNWIKIPLSIEFRAMYGLGEITAGTILGRERYSNSELAFHLGSQVSQVLPLDVLEGGGGWHAFIPSVIKPFVEAAENRSWTGMPIYRDSPFNENDPEWTKAYSNTNKTLVSAAEWLNEISGGDRYKKGAIDINPAQVEYMLNGYFGGVSSTINKLANTAEMMIGERDFDWRNVPIANRVLTRGDERTEQRKIRNDYFKYKERCEETKRLLKKYEAEADNGVFEYAERLDFLNNSKDYGLYEIYDEIQPDINSIRKEMKDATDEERKGLEKEERALQKEMVLKMRALEDAK